MPSRRIQPQTAYVSPINFSCNITVLESGFTSLHKLLSTPISIVLRLKPLRFGRDFFLPQVIPTEIQTPHMLALTHDPHQTNPERYPA
jgi:hypothetical protein